MSRAQVRFALGSPLVVDPFHTDRWDYVYSYQKQGKDIERRRITVIFDDDKLVRIEGDVVPMNTLQATEKPAVKSAAEATPANKPDAATPVFLYPALPIEKSAAKPPVAATPAAKSEVAPAEASRTDTAKSAAEKERPKEEKGFFGRMLEKIGF
jgi:hypothetical protein